MSHDSDLDTIPATDTPLSAAELIALRRIISDEQHATWLRKKLKVFLPWAIGIATGLATLWHLLSDTPKP